MNAMPPRFVSRVLPLVLPSGAAALLAATLLGCGATPEVLHTTAAMPTPIDRTVPPPPGAPRPFALPEVQTVRLPNGLEVVLVNRPAYPTLSMRLSVRAGLADAPNPATADLVARLLRDGTSNRDATQIAQYIDGNGLAYGAGTEATRAVLSVDGLSDQLDEMAGLLFELVQDATLPDDRIDARRAEYIAELEVAATQPEYHRQRATSRVLYGEHAWGRFIEPTTVSEVTNEDIRTFFATSWAPNRARLVVVGALPDDALTRIESLAAGWTRQAANWEATDLPTIRTCNEGHAVVRPNSAQTLIHWTAAGPATTDPDWHAAEVANQVLGGGASSRLFWNLREEKSYTYGAYSRIGDTLGVGWFFAGASVRSEVTTPAAAEFRVEYARIHDEGFPTEELQGAIDYLAGSFVIRMERNSALAGELSRVLDQGRTVRWLADWRTNIQSVTEDAALAAGRRFVDADQMALILVGEADAVREAALPLVSTLYLYDLSGALIETVPGERASTCE